MKAIDSRDILPATAGQRIAMARLYMALNIKEPLEDAPMTLGEAGREIRALIGKLTIYKRR